MKRRPTRRAFVIAGIGLLLIVAGATAQAGWLFVLAAGVFGLLFGSIVYRHPLRGLTIERRVPQRVRVGDDVGVRIAVDDPSRRSVPIFTIEDSFPAFEPLRVGVERLAPGESAEIETVRVAIRRGRFAGGEAKVTCGAPFGLMTTRRTIPVGSDVTVVPRWVDLRAFPLAEPSSSPSDVLHERPRAGGGEEFLGVRGFRPGDPLRSIHWRSTARAGTLVVKEYEQEISNRTALVLAGADHGEGTGSSFETLVSACASVGLHALSLNHPVLAVAPRDEHIDHLIDPSRNGLLDWLATVQATDVALDGLVEETLVRIGQRGTVVIFTTSGGACGASVLSAVARVERAGARAVLVLAHSGSWTGAAATGSLPLPGASVPTRVLVNGKELGACLAA